ncbi:uncharacterized protein ATNIH1004_006380 [Aspergillus tanneri]|uniref:Uncharacterized protein n=1 Tax=Aspergillus tanneri TaxID=1220188 RepID=A0A5M9MP09_9EURO|nr:uncharacterized protein ATNIH1004_006380 [Aspergillus tanneri]KAA8647686.1 hypothetical protein ATNIH1004_006380 [Aspergillus tanneri]
MRARVCGAKLVIGLAVHHDLNIVHKAFLELHAHRYYDYVIVRVVTNGGICIGLTSTLEFLDEEDRQLNSTTPAKKRRDP